MMIGNRNAFKNSESFKNVEKDLSYIVSKIAEDEQLLKLLSLQEDKEEKLTSEEKRKILKECVHIVPVLDLRELENDNRSHLVVFFDNFFPNGENPEYRNKFLFFNIVCEISTWNMRDFKLRPYQIAGRLDVLFDKKKLANSYSINFLDANGKIISDNFGGLTLAYDVIYNIDGDKRDELE